MSSVEAHPKPNHGNEEASIVPEAFQGLLEPIVDIPKAVDNFHDKLVKPATTDNFFKVAGTLQELVTGKQGAGSESSSDSGHAHH